MAVIELVIGAEVLSEAYTSLTAVQVRVVIAGALYLDDWTALKYERELPLCPLMR